MKTEPVVPARVELDADGTPIAPEFGDIYHPRDGALEQARHVFLAGNGLPARWRGRDAFVILETGFGLGNNFLATWLAWRDDPQRSSKLHFASIESRPLRATDLASVPRDPLLVPLAGELVSAWPPLTPNLHRLSFESGRVQLLVAFGDVAAWLPQIEATVDAFFLDGFAPAKNPQMWDGRLFKAMARLAARDATAATWSVAGPVREGLRSAGFDCIRAPGRGGKREITVARFTPRFAPRSPPRRTASIGKDRATDERVLVVGAGLAGCATAWALAEQGIRSTLMERGPEIAGEGSGNAAGIFHGVVHRDDGRHARFNRAAALEASRQVAIAIAAHGVAGSVAGLLRLEPQAVGTAGLQGAISRLGLPAEYVLAVTADTASELAGVAVDAPAWFYPAGGWVDPRGLARSFIERAGEFAELRRNVEVTRLHRGDDGRWQLHDARAQVLATANVVVLANAGGALDLLGAGAVGLLERRRGQVSALPISSWPGIGSLALPVAGAGYALPASHGLAWFGATSQVDDSETALRNEDHLDNLERLRRLFAAAPALDPRSLSGRVSFRYSMIDRLPLVGAVPLSMLGPDLARHFLARASPRPEQPRFAPRAPGLYVLSALGSRGIAWSALGAQVLAAAINGAPAPLEADLLDAIDPARFASRKVRRAASASQAPEGPMAGGSAGA